MQQRQEEYDEEEEEIDLESIEDEATLLQLLDETEDVDERKRIRDRLRKVQFEIKAQREKDRLMREDAREMKIRNRVKEADLRKKQTLEMYDKMARDKRQPAGAGGAEKKRDLVEETIRDRVRAADDRKKRTMAAFEHAAASQPAGQARIVEYDTFSMADVSKLEPAKAIPKGSCCFGSSGGVPKIDKAAVKATSAPKKDESHLDSRERAIRARVQEADERKRRILAAYDMAARTGGAGPKDVILQEFTNLDVSKDAKKSPKYDPCFRGLKV